MPRHRALTPELIEARAAEFKHLRSQLGLPPDELSKVTGLAVTSLAQLPYIPAGRIPSTRVIESMRKELNRRQRLGIPKPKKKVGPRKVTPPEEFKRRRLEYVALRQKLGLSSQELANLTGLSLNTIQNFPGWTVKHAPTLATLALMRGALDRLT